MTKSGGTTDTCETDADAATALAVTAKATAVATCAVKNIQIDIQEPVLSMELDALRADTYMQNIAQIIMTGSAKTDLPADKKEEIVDKLFGCKEIKVQQK
ncbi:uncharacterized protein TEOVI_000760300 [Trypanosoma equiperdum]|uniref:Uncharacterized protein n=1 Tax=Trypanosoma equiperdum TaxID=5694 RepID=A0A1G4I5E2_TRYEQ|nr:hypothetical protein TEOVI_000760300 [Trypanosoma equiperdum]